VFCKLNAVAVPLPVPCLNVACQGCDVCVAQVAVVGVVCQPFGRLLWRYGLHTGGYGGGHGVAPLWLLILPFKALAGVGWCSWWGAACWGASALFLRRFAYASSGASSTIAASMSAMPFCGCMRCQLFRWLRMPVVISMWWVVSVQPMSRKWSMLLLVESRSLSWLRVMVCIVAAP